MEKQQQTEDLRGAKVFVVTTTSAVNITAAEVSVFSEERAALDYLVELGFAISDDVQQVSEQKTSKGPYGSTKSEALMSNGNFVVIGEVTEAMIY
jgi:hypothetical protein